MSRPQHHKAVRLIPAAIGLGAVLALTGCSAGLQAETTTEVAAINGGSVSVRQMDIRNAVFTFPTGQAYYPAGAAMPLSAVLINTSTQNDRLLRVSSTYARSVEVSGDTSLPAGTALRATGILPTSLQAPMSSVQAVPSRSATPTSNATPTTSASPTSSVAPTTSAAPAAGPDFAQLPTSEPAVTITLIGATQRITPGVTIPVTFVFQHAGSITVQVPIGPDPTPVPQSSPQP